ncbi:SH3 domain-containing protein [Bacillus cereus]|uniref:SH3 domain-containing protein n=1 Tax=Bacillus cereus TaxID=1396 RepID=UPI0010BF5B87|nr:SH3 domain-containing protein [Bacillus cereus]TKH99084.1 hypothetical protein FC693_08250 [Bacillus cereus]HDR8053230.1 hypothetical protein [Bacillus cereus]
MKYIVIKSHVSNYPNPIRLEEGNVVKMIESYADPENWMFCQEEKYDRKGWVWCEGRDGEEGWVPKENLQKY